MRNNRAVRDQTPPLFDESVDCDHVSVQGLVVFERLDLILDLASLALRNCAPNETPDFTPVRRELHADASRTDDDVLSVLDLLVGLALDATRASLAKRASAFATLSDLLDHGIESCPGVGIFARSCVYGCSAAVGVAVSSDLSAEEPRLSGPFEQQADRDHEPEYGPTPTYQRRSNGDVDGESSSHDVISNSRGMARFGAVQGSPCLIPASRDQAGRTSDASNGA